jgi:hypothetical protein
MRARARPAGAVWVVGHGGENNFRAPTSFKSYVA